MKRMIKTRATGGTKSSQVTLEQTQHFVLSGILGNNLPDYAGADTAQGLLKNYREG
jgi:hypothetical protein